MKTIKHTILAATLVLAASATIFAQSGNYNADIKQSKLVWVGKKVVGEHTGTINISKGNLVVDKSLIKSGSFNIDMKSIVDKDLTDADYNAKLIGHLKSDDFFGVEKFPVATLVITESKAAGKGALAVKGNLTIKGKTLPVEFASTYSEKGKVIAYKAKITVNRAKYDIRYGSRSFFDNIGDKAIEDDFTLDVDLVVSK